MDNTETHYELAMCNRLWKYSWKYATDILFVHLPGPPPSPLTGNWLTCRAAHTLGMTNKESLH
jgi:hypothetical protein